MTHAEWMKKMTDLESRMKTADGAEHLRLFRQAVDLAKRAPGLQPNQELEASLEELKALNGAGSSRIAQ